MAIESVLSFVVSVLRMTFEFIVDMPLAILLVGGFWFIYGGVFLMVRGGRHARRIMQGVEYKPLDEID